MKNKVASHDIPSGVLKIDLLDLADTREFGTKLASLLRPGDIILLSGDLGAGKTTLARATGEKLGLDPRDITSPTFAIIHEYPGAKIPLVHADIYRLGENADIEETGLEEYMTSGSHAVIIEWSEFLSDDLVTAALEINIKYSDILHDSGRTLFIKAKGASWQERLSNLEKWHNNRDRR